MNQGLVTESKAAIGCREGRIGARWAEGATRQNGGFRFRVSRYIQASTYFCPVDYRIIAHKSFGTPFSRGKTFTLAAAERRAPRRSAIGPLRVSRQCYNLPASRLAKHKWCSGTSVRDSTNCVHSNLLLESKKVPAFVHLSGNCTNVNSSKNVNCRQLTPSVMRLSFPKFRSMASTNLSSK